MNMQLDPHVKAVFDEIVAHTPDIGPAPSDEATSTDPRRSDGGRRWLPIAAAAVVLVGVGAIVVVQRPGSDTPATQPTTPRADVVDPAPGGVMLLDPLPETLADADVSALPGPDPVATPVAPDQDWIRRWYTTTIDRPEQSPHLDVSSLSTTQPVPPVADDATSVTVRGVDGWLYDDPFGPGRSVAFHDGQTMFVLTGYQLSDDELLFAADNTVLADASSVGAVVDSGALPAGLTERAVGTVFEKHFLPLEIQQHENPTIRWDAGDVSVWMESIVEDPALVPLHRLGYDTVTDTTVRNQTAFVTTITAQPAYVGVTWSENGITYLLGSNGLTADTVVDYANRLRPATRDEWNSLLTNPPTISDDAPDPIVVVATTTLNEPEETGPVESRTPVTGEPTSFPVLDHPAEGQTIRADVQRIEAGVTTPRSELLLGRRVDGGLTDAVAITAQATPFGTSPAAGRPPVDTVVMGEPATVLDRSSIPGDRIYVLWGPGPYFLAEGDDPLDLLDRLDVGAIHAVVDAGVDQPPLIGGGPLPDRYELIAGPQIIGHTPTTAATLTIQPDNDTVTVSTHNPLIQIALNEPLREITVDGQPAWTTLTSSATQEVTWQVDDNTYIHIRTRSADPLELADNLDFVDADTWNTRYLPETNALTPTTAPQ